MPIEIRELVIRAEVTGDSQKPEPAVSPTTRGREMEREALIQACVEQVLRALRRERER